MIEMPTPKRYRGNTPKSVRRAAKYRVKRDSGEWAVELQYELDNRSRALLTTREHPALVDMVNQVKEAVNEGPGGAFYINEYGQVLVPSSEGDYYVAGEYRDDLEFDLDGEIISGRPPEGLSPGDDWNGPHVGIPYTLAAGGDDIRYEVQFSNIVERRLLSDEVGITPAHELAQRLAKNKSFGGVIYINECQEFFAPINHEGELRYIYLGPLGSDEWFAPPAT